MDRKKRSPMSRTVTFGELEELKGWMTTNFVTKQEFDQRVGGLEKHMNSFEQRMDDFNDKMLTGFDRIYGSLETLTQEVSLLNGAVKRIEGG